MRRQVHLLLLLLAIPACSDAGPGAVDSQDEAEEGDGDFPLFGDAVGGGGQAAVGGGASEGAGTGSGGEAFGAGGTFTEPVTLTLQESEPGFCDFSGVIESEHAGFTGVGYANGDAGVGQGIEWVVTAAGGSVDLSWTYATAAARPATLYVNDTERGMIDFASTTEWTSWQTVGTTVTLEAGVNVIRLEAQDASGLANIDHLILAGDGIAPASCGPDPEPGSTDLIGFATLNGGTTGGEGGQVVSASSYAELKSYAESATPYVIIIDGTITNGSGGGQVNVGPNKSLIGVGSTAFLSGVGLGISNSNNIIIQNLRISLIGVTTPTSINDGDAISISGTSRNIWIDHCELFSEDPNVQTSIDKYDGLIDIKGQTGFITVSWNYLHDHHKGGLVGAADDDLYADRKITFHHNYYNKVKLRVPMYRGSTGHFFNNYVVGAQDATEIRAGTCVRVEKNHYEALHYSIYTTSDSPGSTQRVDNIEVTRTERAYPSNCTADIPYDYAGALTTTTMDVKTVVPAGAGVGKI
jgi:pectate lyase